VDGEQFPLTGFGSQFTMRIFFVLLAVLGCVASRDVARADSNFMHGTGGTLQALQPVPKIRLLREQVHAEIFAAHCDTTATFELRNHGAARTIAVAFAESQYSSSFVRFKRFSLSVGGRALPARRVIGRATSDGTRPSRWISRVRFEPGQRRVVRVRYRSNYEGLLHAGNFEYKFNAGGWSGAVAASRLRVTFRAPGTHFCQASLSPVPFADEKDAVALKRSGASLLFERRNWRPRGRFSLVFEPTFTPGWLSYSGIAPRQYSVWVPGSPVGVNSAVLWLPPAVLRGGTTFVSLDELDSRLAARATEEDGTQRSKALQWKEGSTSATLRVGATRCSSRPRARPCASTGAAWLCLARRSSRTARAMIQASTHTSTFRSPQSCALSEERRASMPGRIASTSAGRCSASRSGTEKGAEAGATWNRLNRVPQVLEVLKSLCAAVALEYAKH
jgi:hypothetical protein